MSAHQPHQLKLIWLHWTVAHAAGVGTFVAWAVLYEELQEKSHAVRQHDAAFSIFGVLGIFLFLASLEQLMLRSAGWRAPLWAVNSALGFVIGGALGIIVGDIGWYIRLNYPWKFYMFAAMFTWGCVLGGFQFLAVRVGGLQHFVWMVVSGLAMFAAGSTLFLFPHYPLMQTGEMIMAATTMGGCYGLITGGALVYLLAREQPRHRRESATSSE